MVNPFDSVVIGFDHGTMINLNYDDLFAAAGLDSPNLESILNEDYLTNIKLSLLRFIKKGTSSSSDYKLKTEDVMFVSPEQSSVILDPSLKIKSGYIKLILGCKINNPIFLDIDNFIFNEYGNRASTTDFRIIAEDYTGNLSKGELLHLVSVLTLISGKVIFTPIGVTHLNDRYNKFGILSIIQTEGKVLHAKLLSKNDMQPRSLPNLRTSTKIK